MEEYVRRPIPQTTLRASDGSVVLPAELTRRGPALIVFAGLTPQGQDVLMELPSWEQRLPQVRVVAVVPEDLRDEVSRRPPP